MIPVRARHFCTDIDTGNTRTRVLVLCTGLSTGLYALVPYGVVGAICRIRALM